MTYDEKHTENSKLAKLEYQKERSASHERKIWHQCIEQAKHSIDLALSSSSTLTDIRSALRDSGAHMAVFRHLMAPPCSQDQFRLLVPEWSKSSEKSGRELADSVAAKSELAILEWLDPDIAPWIASNRVPTNVELTVLVQRTAVIMANQAYQTARRNFLAAEQEGAVKTLLLAAGWTQLPAKLIDQRADVPEKRFMHKTRFATRTQPQEVDLALGLPGTYVAAMECKVSNDETNSVKRINDVIKKAEAWKAHWGSFVEPVALLKGVIKANDVHRLLDAGVTVFWSHDLKELNEWLENRFS